MPRGASAAAVASSRKTSRPSGSSHSTQKSFTTHLKAPTKRQKKAHYNQSSGNPEAKAWNVLAFSKEPHLGMALERNYERIQRPSRFVSQPDARRGDFFSVVFPHLVEPLGLVLQNRREEAVVVGFSRTTDAKQGPAEQVGVIQKGDILCGVNDCLFPTSYVPEERNVDGIQNVTFEQKITILRDAVGEVTLHFFRRASLQFPTEGFAGFWSKAVYKAMKTRKETPFQADGVNLNPSALDFRSMKEAPLENQLRTARIKHLTSQGVADQEAEDKKEESKLKWKEPSKNSEHMFVNQFCRVLYQYKTSAVSHCTRIPSWRN
eukprot:gb/GECG01004064.1/.p1 GENE.gb/GECG01004064.1/~~gb/GECG01004064.1/.p1  ORF type:complete len:320 (+),score=33.68 gb/GECG01004064.1/:1-960(+)